jgi:hypothetical protein
MTRSTLMSLPPRRVFLDVLMNWFQISEQKDVIMKCLESEHCDVGPLNEQVPTIKNFFLVRRVPVGGPEQRESDKTVLYPLIEIIILISYIIIYYY